MKTLAKFPLVYVVLSLAVAAQSALAQPAAKAKPKAESPRKAPAEKIDWAKARRLHRKFLNGEKLTKEERAYYEKAKQARRRQKRPRRGKPQSREGKASLGLTPLTDFKAGQKYKGQDGGLYGGGRNAPPPAHLKAALVQAAKIQPLDAKGRPAKDGKIVLLSNGMSNTTQEFQQFLRLANADRDKSPAVAIVDGAFGGQEASDWAYPEKRFRKQRPSPWDQLDRRLKQAGVTPLQVQVMWILQARRGPARLGEFPRHAQQLQRDLVVLLHKLKRKFPNLRIAYLSSRIYAGYANTPLNPEPYAYESAFSVRWLIADQIKGDPQLKYESEARAPLLLWGPYLWADGVKGRNVDKLIWKRDDLARDGTHPAAGGRRKVAGLLLGFFKTDPTTKGWFLRKRD